MSITIGPNEQVNFNLDDFRGMVNYEYGKNKGYVRLTRDANNKLTMEKFNNKVDVAFIFRKNTGAVESRAIRDALVRALASRMIGVAERDMKEIREMILGEGGAGAIANKPLSRREIRNVLAKFDVLMNTVEGRKDRAFSVLDKAYETARFDFGKKFPGKAFMEKNVFLSKYMGLKDGIRSPQFEKMFDEANLDIPLEDAADPKRKAENDENVVATRTMLDEWKENEKGKVLIMKDNLMAHDTHGARRTTPMEVSDLVFDRVLERIQAQTQKAIALIELETDLTDAIDATMDPHAKVSTEPNDPFAGSGLSKELKTKIENNLKGLLQARGVDVDLSAGTDVVGSKGEVFRMFMDKVVPVMFRAARQEAQIARDAGMDDQTGGTFLSTASLADAATRFIDGYAALKEGVNKAAEGKAPQDRKDAIVEFMKGWCTFAAEKLNEQAFFMDVRERIVLTTGMSKEDRAKTDIIGQLMRDFVDAKDASRLEFFTQAFLAKNYPAVNLGEDVKPRTQQEIAANRLDKATLALKLNYGERWSTGNGRLHQTFNATVFLRKTNDLLVDIVNHYGNGDLDDMLEMCNVLGEARIGKMMNVRIERALAGGVSETHLSLDDVDVQKMDAPLQAAAKLYVLFTKKAGAKMTANLSTFEKMLAKDVKKGRLTAEQARAVYADVLYKTQRAIMKDARAAFVRDLPTDTLTHAEIDTFVKAQAKKIDDAVKRSLTEINGIVRERLNIELLANGRITHAAKTGLAEASAVTRFTASPACADKLLGQKMRPAFERLYNRIVGEALGAVKGDKRLDAKESQALLARVDTQFAEEARKLYAQVAKLKNDVGGYLVKEIAICFEGLLAGELKPDAKWKAYAQNLSKGDRKVLAAQMSKEAVSRLQDKINEVFDRVAKNPESYKKLGDIKAFVQESILENGSTLDTADRQIEAIIRERAAAIDAWTGKTEAEKTKFFRACGAGALAVIQKERHLENLDLVTMTGFRAVLDACRKTVTERVKTLPLHYASTFSKAALSGKVQDEIANLAKGRVETFLKEWNKFLADKETAKIVENYGGLGSEKIERVKAHVARMIGGSADGKNIKASAMSKLFVALLGQELDAEIQAIEDDVDAYLARVDKALAGVAEAKKNFHEAFLKRANETNLPAKVVSYFEGTIMERFANVMYTRACVDPEAFEEADFSVQAGAGELAEVLFQDMEKADILGPNGYRELIHEAGVRTGKSIPPETLQRMEANVAQFVKLDRIIAQREELLIAQMEISFAMGREKVDYEKTSPTARDRLEAFQNEICEICNPVIGEINLEKFCARDFNEAVMLFGAWLDGYEATYPLPDALYNGKTVRDMAIDLFRERFDEIKPRLLGDDRPNAADLKTFNLKFLQDLSNLFAVKAVDIAVTDILAVGIDKVVARFEESAKMDDGDIPFRMSPDLEARRFEKEWSRLAAVVTANHEALLRTISDNVKLAREEILSTLTSYEGLGRMKEKVVETADKLMNREKRSLILTATRRYTAAKGALDGRRFQMAKMNEHLERMRKILAANLPTCKFSDKFLKQTSAFFAFVRKNFADLVELDCRKLNTYARGYDVTFPCSGSIEDFVKGLTTKSKVFEFFDMLTAAKNKTFGDDTKAMAKWFADYLDGVERGRTDVDLLFG